MAKINYDPVAELNLHSPSIVARFAFERPEVCVKNSILEEDKHDPEIYDGTVVSSYGYYRIARHRPTGALLLLASKSPHNLRGKRDEENRIIAQKKHLERSYIVAAYRNSGKDEDAYIAARPLRRSLRAFGKDLAERCEKHFTLYGAQINNPQGKAKLFNTETPTEVWTNGRLAYLIDQTKKGDWKVTFYAPTTRKGGSFVPVTLGTKKLKDTFSRVSRTVATAKSYEDAREEMAAHWQRVSSRLWDEESIYKGEGILLQTKKILSATFNAISENRYGALATLPFGLLLAAIKPSFGALYAIGYAATHYLGHEVFTESMKTTYEAYSRAKRARKRLSIESYEMGTDASDHFKIQTTANISKTASKIDLDRFKAEEFEFLDSNVSGMLRDHEFVRNDFLPDSLKDQLLSMHQRGFSSSCLLPDRHTRLDMFQNGVVRLMHEMEDGSIRIYAGYRPELCKVEALRLPPEYIEKLKDGLLEIKYDRKAVAFNQAFAQKRVTIAEAMGVINESLFRNDPDATTETKTHSLHSIRQVLVKCMGVNDVIEPEIKYSKAPDLLAVIPNSASLQPAA